MPSSHVALGARLDHRTRVANGTTFTPHANLIWPGTHWALMLVVEQRVRKNSHATLTEVSLLF